jgi:MFS family permease
VTDFSADQFRGLRSRGAIVTLLGVTQILAWGSSYYLLAVLAGDIATDTDWPSALVVGGLSLGLVFAGLVSPVVGRRIGNGHGRAVLASSSFFLAAGLFCLGFASSVPMYLAACVIVGVGMGAGLYDAAFAMLGTLYGLEARRTTQR